MMPANAGARPRLAATNRAVRVGLHMLWKLGPLVHAPIGASMHICGRSGHVHGFRALWTMARRGFEDHHSDFRNRAYSVWSVSFPTFGRRRHGLRARDLFEIGHPRHRLGELGKGMGACACVLLRRGLRGGL